MQGLVAGAADRGRSAVQCVLCLGHNKGMEEAASDLAVRAMAVFPGASARLGDLMRPIHPEACDKSTATEFGPLMTMAPLHARSTVAPDERRACWRCWRPRVGP